MVYLIEKKSLPTQFEFEVERGPGWLFVRLPDIPLYDQSTNLADQLWTLLNQHFVYRLVLEMDEVHLLSSSLMGQLVMLQKRVLQHDGALRLCGLSPSCQQALHLCRLDQIMPNFPTQEAAVRAYACSKPR